MRIQSCRTGDIVLIDVEKVRSFPSELRRMVSCGITEVEIKYNDGDGFGVRAVDSTGRIHDAYAMYHRFKLKSSLEEDSHEI